MVCPWCGWELKSIDTTDPRVFRSRMNDEECTNPFCLFYYIGERILTSNATSGD